MVGPGQCVVTCMGDAMVSVLTTVQSEQLGPGVPSCIDIGNTRGQTERGWLGMAVVFVGVWLSVLRALDG